MSGSARMNGRQPLISESGVCLRVDLRGGKLMEEIVGGLLREAEVSGGEILVEHGCAEEIAHLLLFHRIARNGEDVSAAGVDGAGGFSVQRREESEGSIFKLKLGIATAKLNARAGLDLVNGGGVDLQAVEGSEDFGGFARRRLLRRKRHGK